mmetsp:Transcript_73121/g.165848  ORF Transcript_73121/g.165848 Transcript_73121/m.165848 type:complete len:134 (+) Transcript_73121:1417-1818(+)
MTTPLQTVTPLAQDLLQAPLQQVRTWPSKTALEWTHALEEEEWASFAQVSILQVPRGVQAGFAPAATMASPREPLHRHPLELLPGLALPWKTPQLCATSWPMMAAASSGCTLVAMSSSWMVVQWGKARDGINN